MRDIEGSKNPNWRGGRNAPCARCGKEVWVKPSKAKKRSKVFCGRDCLFAYRVGENCSRWSGGSEPRKCPECGKDFLATRREINRGGGVYCSRRCVGAARSDRVPAVCEFCKAPFMMKRHRIGTSRFCSRPCKKASQIKERSPDELARNRLRGRMSSQIWQALKGKKAGRSWEKLVGYTVADLVRHLESQFRDGMSWDNMGEWHIDHIRPCSSFMYTTPDDEQFHQCWAMSNLQPLWWDENLRKGSKVLAG